MKHFAIILSFCIYFLNANAQNVGYYIDRFEDLYIFEDGITMKAEHQLVTDVQIGKNFVFYQNSQGDFMMYKDGDKRKLSPNVPNYFKAQRNTVVTDMYGGIAALANKEFKSLTLRTNLPFSSNDSIVAYEDYDNYINVFYNNEKKEIAGPDIFNFKTSSNSVAYIDADQTLYLNNNFESEEVESSLPQDVTFMQALQENVKRFGSFWVNSTSEQSINNDNFGYWVGNNKVAYISEFNEFVMYENGETTTLSEYTPLAVFPGFNVLAYISEEEDFYIYQNGNNELISNGNIKNLIVKDDVVVWTNTNQDFYCWYNGKQIKLENYIPQKVKIDLNNVVYTDLDNRLWSFYEGEKVQVSKRQVNDFNIFGKVIVYRYNIDDYSFYWNGNVYNKDK